MRFSIVESASKELEQLLYRRSCAPVHLGVIVVRKVGDEGL